MMAKLILKVKVRWWVKPALYAYAWICHLCDVELNDAVIDRVVALGFMCRVEGSRRWRNINRVLGNG